MEIPVYLVAGFLDSGKTSFINGVLQDGIALDDPTLLICCEEGMEEYDDRYLQNVTVVTVDAETDLTKGFLKGLEFKHRPKQVIMEFNGMWSMQHFYLDVLPNNWVLYQIMTMVYAPSFEAYARNLGQLMMEKITNADMIIFNRCTEKERTALRQRNLKMVNRRASIYLENDDGSSEDYVDDSICPFDLSQDVIEIPDDDFGVWYVDVMDHPDRYDGKKIHTKAVVAHIPQYPKDVVLGRFAMTCCAADVTFLGVIGRGEEMDIYPNRAWVDVKAHIAVESHKAYEDKGPILYVDAVEPAKKADPEVISF